MIVFVRIFDSVKKKELFYGAIEAEVTNSFTPQDVWIEGKDLNDSPVRMKVYQCLNCKIKYSDLIFFTEGFLVFENGEFFQQTYLINYSYCFERELINDNYRISTFEYPIFFDNYKVIEKSFEL